MSAERQQLEQTIAALEAQRALLGDEVVETALAPLREKLADLQRPASALPQRKILTILFADLSGFTALSETLDAEDVAGLVNQLWDKVDQTLLTHGGQIDKHIGDAVMALWGAGVAREDDAEQAIRAALAVQAEILAWQASAANPLVARLHLRIGINTGPTLLGSVGSKHEYTAMGDTVNLAARLVESAAPGSIVIAHATYRQVRGLFDVVAQPALHVKGKAEAVQTYLVKNAKPRAFRLQTRGVEGIETHMVGRAAELEALKQAMVDVLEGRTRRSLTVLAEAGMGKSRLLYELNAWGELLPGWWYLFRGRADETMTRSPYALWRDVFSFRFEIQDSDRREVACTKLEQGMADLLPGEERSQQIAHILGHLIGLDFSASPHVQPLLANPAQLQAAARAALVYLFSALSARLPVALQLEDIHWADDGSLDLLEHLSAALPPDTPLLLIYLARPTLLERRPDWANQPAHLSLPLRPLSADESGQLAGEILQKLPQPLLNLQRLVVNNAAGNPFYLEELIKMLIDEGAIIPGDESWSVNQERLQILKVPATLTGILQARLDNLSQPERLALQRAAIIGQVFWDDAVRHLARHNAASLPIGTLTGVQNKELIYPRQPAAFAGSREFGFKHAILRDVTYDTVLKRERPALHALAAEWLAQRSGERVDEFAALIADHYELAGDPLHAAQYLYRVALRAHALSSYDESLAALTRLIGLIESDARPEAQRLQLEARIRVGEIYGRGLDDYTKAGQHLESALELARQQADPRNLAAALGQLGWVASRHGDFGRARACYNEALPLARALDDQPQQIYLTRQLGNIALTAGQYDLASARYHESLDIAVHSHDLAGQAHAQASIGLVYVNQGDPHTALRQFLLGVELFRQLGDRRYTTTALTNVAEAHLKLGQYAEASRAAQEALELGQQIGSTHSVASASRHLATAAWGIGERAAARSHLNESIRICHALGEIPDQLELTAIFSGWLCSAGQLALAAHLLACVTQHPAYNAYAIAIVHSLLEQYPLTLPASSDLSLDEAVALVLETDL